MFTRQLSLSGFTQQHLNSLKSACVGLIGCGGLGCSAALHLTGSGVGKIVFVDGDKIELTNIHRQIAYTVDDIGKYKTLCLKDRCLKINPELLYECHNLFIEDCNILKDCDVILDCSDNANTRIMLNEYCKEAKKPLIFGSAISYDGQLCVFNFKKDSKCLFCVFPEIDKVKDTCDGMGVLGPVPGIIGTLQAIECIKLISGLGEVVKGLLHYSSFDTSFNYIEVEEGCSCCNKKEYDKGCEITYDEYIKNKGEYILYDIREDIGEDDEHILGSIQEQNINNITFNQNVKYAFICSIGQVSLNTVKELRDRGVKNCWSIKHGFRGI